MAAGPRWWLLHILITEQEAQDEIGENQLMSNWKVYPLETTAMIQVSPESLRNTASYGPHVQT